MTKIYIVIEGGCVRYVASDIPDAAVVVVDLDDMNDAEGADREVIKADLKVAEGLPRIW